MIILTSTYACTLKYDTAGADPGFGQGGAPASEADSC